MNKREYCSSKGVHSAGGLADWVQKANEEMFPISKTLWEDSSLSNLRNALPNIVDFYVLEISNDASKWIADNRLELAKSLVRSEGNPLSDENVARKLDNVNVGHVTEFALNEKKSEQCLSEWKKRSLLGEPDPGFDHPSGYYSFKWDTKTSRLTSGRTHLGDYSLPGPLYPKADIYIQSLILPDETRIILGYATKEMIQVIEPTAKYVRSRKKRHLSFSKLLPLSKEIVAELGLSSKLER